MSLASVSVSSDSDTTVSTLSLIAASTVRTGHNSADDSQVWSATSSIASDTNLLLLSGITEEGHDAQFPGGDILPTRYERDRFDVDDDLYRVVPTNAVLSTSVTACGWDSASKT